jgi:hypothetical protein
MMGIPERNVPNTGINPAINTISDRVKINGKTGSSPDHHR